MAAKICISNIFLKQRKCSLLKTKRQQRKAKRFQRSRNSANALFFFPVCWVVFSGFHRNSQEKAGLLEAAGPQTAPLVPSESYAGHAWVPSERVRALTFFNLWSSSLARELPHQFNVTLRSSLSVSSLPFSLSPSFPDWNCCCRFLWNGLNSWRVLLISIACFFCVCFATPAGPMGPTPSPQQVL